MFEGNVSQRYIRYMPPLDGRGRGRSSCTNKQTNKNTLFRNTGYSETVYNKLRIPYYIMQQLVKTNRFINIGKFYKVEF